MLRLSGAPRIIARAAVWACCLAVIVAAGITGPARAADSVRLLVFGDSLTAGYGLSGAEAFPAQLERALKARGHAVTVINAGVSGDTTAGGKARLDWSLGAGDKPDAAIVELGANDGLRGLEPASTRANLDAIVTRFKREGLPVLLAGMLAPRNLGEEYAAEFDAIYPSLARKHDVLFYPFFLDGVAMQPEFNQGDGLHPNAKGVARIVERIMPAVEQLLERAGAKEAGKAKGGAE